MNFAYTILYVSDVSRTVSFYEKAFGLKKRFIHESGDYAELETGATTLSFTSNELAQSNLPAGFRENDLSHPPAGIEIAFTTDDVPVAFTRALKAGATEVAKPQMKPWGQQVAYARDLDGVLVEIASPL
jgi:uncharacterized glyoxalase superfamily protein PhnB